MVVQAIFDSDSNKVVGYRRRVAYRNANGDRVYRYRLLKKEDWPTSAEAKKAAIDATRTRRRRRSRSNTQSRSKSRRRTLSSSKSRSRGRKATKSSAGRALRKYYLNNKWRRSKSRSKSQSSRRRSKSQSKSRPLRRRSKSQSLRRRSKSQSRSSRKVRCRNCWGDLTLSELRALTQDIGGRMYKDRQSLCNQLNRHYGIEESIERARSVSREARAVKVAARKLARAARKSRSRSTVSRHVLPDGAYPGEAQALSDFIDGYSRKTFKTAAARAQSMSRDLGTTGKVIRRQDKASYEAWKNEPWNYDIDGIDTQGSDSSFIENFRKGGLARE